MITTADVQLGTGYGGSVDVPFRVTGVENDLQAALGRIRGTAVIDTDHAERIDDTTRWQYRFVVDATNQRVILDRLELPDGADTMRYTDRDPIDSEAVDPGVDVEEYERALAQLLRRTDETDAGGLTTTRGDAILTVVYRTFSEYSDAEIATTDALPFDSYADIEAHFLREAPRQLWRSLTDGDRIGDARATTLVLVSGATEPADLRDNVDPGQWDEIRSVLEFPEE